MEENEFKTTLITQTIIEQNIPRKINMSLFIVKQLNKSTFKKLKLNDFLKFLIKTLKDMDLMRLIYLRQHLIDSVDGFQYFDNPKGMTDERVLDPYTYMPKLEQKITDIEFQITNYLSVIYHEFSGEELMIDSMEI